MKPLDLFEFTAACLCCGYISDLRFIRITERQAKVIQEMPESIFTLSEYTRLARYITGGSAEHLSIPDAKAAIITTLLSSPVPPSPCGTPRNQDPVA